MRITAVMLSAALAIMGDAGSAQTAGGKGNADYPPEALAKRERGTVLVDLTIAPDSKISNCKVLVSSNSPSLDQQTCTIFVNQAHFDPARNEQGMPIEDHALGKVTWVIPGCRAPKQRDPRLRRQIPASVTITSVEHC